MAYPFGDLTGSGAENSNLSILKSSGLIYIQAIFTSPLLATPYMTQINNQFVYNTALNTMDAKWKTM